MTVNSVHADALRATPPNVVIGRRHLGARVPVTTISPRFAGTSSEVNGEPETMTRKACLAVAAC
jgi:hypothetical protein